MDENRLKEAMRRCGVTYLKPYQELIIRNYLESEERREREATLINLPTGSGKSLCFMIPIILERGLSLIIYPLRSLINDQKERFRKANIECVALVGGLDRNERERRIREIREGKKKALLTTLEMLEYLIGRGLFERVRVSIAVLDEAHTYLEWGESFRESFKRIPDILERLSPRHILLFSATVDKKNANYLRSIIPKGMKIKSVHDSPSRENIVYEYVRSLSKRGDLIKILSRENALPAIVFCPSREKTKRVRQILEPYFETESYNAGLDREERERIESWFLSSSHGVLAATSAYGMGVDKANIRTVIHIYLPKSASEFLQESGRAGRDGKSAKSYILSYMDEKSPIEGAFRSKECIKSSLLALMGEDIEDSDRKCLSCSSCVKSDYIPYGENEVLKYIRNHPLKREKDIIAFISKRHALKRKGHLSFFDEYDAKRSLRTLLEEKRIKRVLNRIYISPRKRLERPSKAF